MLQYDGINCFSAFDGSDYLITGVVVCFLKDSLSPTIRCFAFGRKIELTDFVQN